MPGTETIRQVAFVVRDLDRAMATWAERGVGPWRVHTFGPDRLPGMAVPGHEQPSAMRPALASAGGIDDEPIEPLDGPSLDAEHLERCGDGPHHLGFDVDDLDAAVAAMAERGDAAL